MAVSRVSLFAWLRDLLRSPQVLHALLASMMLFASGHLAKAQSGRKPAPSDALAKPKFIEPFENESTKESESTEEYDVRTSEAAEFDEWESLVDDNSGQLWEPSTALDQKWRPFDSVRSLGFRHSSTHGRHVGRGIPLEGTSWLNRPYHVDWFAGPLLGDQLIRGRVNQENVSIGGVRIGWDFDHYWGIEWRYGKANPDAQFATPQAVPNRVNYSVSDIDLIYYPWGDSKVRPYGLLGLGAAKFDFVDDAGINHGAVLATIPMGVGIQFRQWSWMLWRLEILDNLSFGDGSLATMHNVSITAGMEMRFGARPASYWPWRSSRRIW